MNTLGLILDSLFLVKKTTTTTRSFVYFIIDLGSIICYLTTFIAYRYLQIVCHNRMINAEKSL